jgi:hypothetical protein
VRSVPQLSFNPFSSAAVGSVWSASPSRNLFSAPSLGLFPMDAYGLSNGLYGYGMGMPFQGLSAMDLQFLYALLSLANLASLTNSSRDLGSLDRSQFSGSPRSTDWGPPRSSFSSSPSPFGTSQSPRGPSMETNEGFMTDGSTPQIGGDPRFGNEIGGDPRFGKELDTMSVRAPWISQFDSRVPGAGNVACARAVKVMGAQAGINITGDRFQVTSSQAAQTARNHIDTQLANGKPVGVVVAHGPRGGRHCVLINGKGQDARGTYYTYLDPGTVHGNIGANTARNRLYVDPRTGSLRRNGENEYGYAYQQSYSLAAVMGTA